MSGMVQSNRKVVRLSKRKIRLIVVVLVSSLIVWAGVSLLPLISSSRRGRDDLMSANDPSISSAESGVQNIGGSIASKMMPNPFRNNQEISVSDTREFLKTNYSASIKTRDVQGVVGSAKNIIKGNDGRIDNLSSSEKSGYLTFVVPKSKFETFLKEIEGLAHKKLFSETNSSQNLLGQKQSIEEQISNINNTLENLKQQKESLLSNHTQTVASINRELASIRVELKVLRKTIDETEDQDVIALLRTQENALVAREATQKQKLATENNKYSAENTSLDNQIKNQNTNLVNVNKQDTKFVENIETVDGSIDVSWISVWEMIKVFSPISPVIIIIVLVLIIWNILARLGYVPKFILE